MRVEVRLFATLTKHRVGVSSGEPFNVTLEDHATLANLVLSLAVPPAEIHLVMIGGRIVHDHSAALTEGARIGLFPPVGGG